MSTKSGKTSFKLLLFFGCATVNKALAIMKLVSKFFFVKEFMVQISKEPITGLKPRIF